MAWRRGRSGEGPSLGRRVTNAIGLTDSPRVRAKTLEKTTPTQLLIVAVAWSVLVVVFTVTLLMEQARGFVWFIISDLIWIWLAVILWVRWNRYRDRLIGSSPNNHRAAPPSA